ncbi:MAG: Pyruvate kinase [Candidatus Wolfebacteria bacterium GW2011_GWC2_39_22]|uniref:Pyruvate kinase n=1 Tax=Candidatus Wolfebacteria bacterium GW2011_GWC2_39_22 TaxID=1619013 RepID=A0A0G0N7N9_9BACT|nr:MAG: Pyruvate kinase [Candidatus Wolfebacteria bacterium GW2011_GWC2_39_22]HBI25216.1 pyruvate kinase [Candidatus Wolfebacteria bacterium]
MKTKIVATIGPKSDSYEELKAMAEAGLNIARMNFSHCTVEEYRGRKEHIARINKELGTDIEIMQDLQGPRIRVGKLPAEGVELKEGETFVFSFEQSEYVLGGIIPIDDAYLHIDVKKGEPFFLANGAMELDIVDVQGSQIHAKVVTGGTLFSKKGINVPRTNLTRGGVTDKDIEDAKFGVAEGVDYIALSFVQSAEDITKLRSVFPDKKIKIIAKIERALALDNIDEIIEESDGIMIARGDLGIEIPMEDLPIIQKNLIRHAHWHNKPAIVATQMMMTLIDHDHPTRAEVSDVANAVFEGGDAVMLSDETAAGKHPAKAVATMAKIVRRIEEYTARENFFETETLGEYKKAKK